MMSILGFTGGVAADMTDDDAAVDVEALGTNALEDVDVFPLPSPVAVATGTDPKAFKFGKGYDCGRGGYWRRNVIY